MRLKNSDLKSAEAKATGIRYMVVPIKRKRKYKHELSILCILSTFIIAIRKGGHKLSPSKKPVSKGNPLVALLHPDIWQNLKSILNKAKVIINKEPAMSRILFTFIVRKSSDEIDINDTTAAKRIYAASLPKRNWQNMKILGRNLLLESASM